MSNEVYSPITNKKYSSLEAMWAAEVRGYVVIIESSRSGTVPAVFGPWLDKTEATKARVRIRNRFNQDEKQRYGGNAGKITSAVSAIWRDPS